MAVRLIRVADGGIAVLCTRRISLVFALAATVPPVALDPPAHYLDRDHNPHLRRLVSAHTRTPVGGSWLDHAVGVWGRGNDRPTYGAAPAYATGNGRMPDELVHSRGKSSATRLGVESPATGDI